MSGLDAANAYFQAWNDRDGAAILASLAAGATYEDPLTGGPIDGAALKTYAEDLWAAFPDLSFEVTATGDMGGGRVAAQWIMRGTNRGSFRGLPPTEKPIESPGSDFIDTRDGKVAKIVGYFDSGAVPRQLGLLITVQPRAIGPFAFGSAVSVQTGNKAAPGAFSVTQLQARGEEEATEVGERSREILAEMLETPGFIGAVTARIGLRLVTLTAWSDTDAPARFMTEGKHGAAMRPFFDGTLADSGFTSSWAPARINPMWVRCQACGTMSDAGKSGKTCACGTDLPDAPPYW